ncbi:substrate-binding periplasmic protein [Pseudomonas sp. NCHU5208]|uniref:substrate-binding periplasmic protein n=1 Tax=unclassified Pseudomonas TaxID=196821 RepID=UPI003F995FA8
MLHRRFRFVAGLALALGLPFAHTAVADSLRIGAEDDWYPYTAWRNDRIEGMSADIVRAAFAATDTALELTPYPYSRCMELARNGFLVACFNTTPDTYIRDHFLLPEHMLFSDDIQLWGPAGSALIDDLEALKGKRVAVTIGYTYGEYFDSYPGIRRIPVRRDLNGFLMLQHRRVDYVIAFRGTTEALLREHPELAGQFVPLARVYRPELYLSFSRHHPQAPELLRRFDEGMLQIRRDGTYQRILETWQTRTGQSTVLGSTLQQRHNDKTESP